MAFRARLWLIALLCAVAGPAAAERDPRLDRALELAVAGDSAAAEAVAQAALAAAGDAGAAWAAREALAAIAHWEGRDVEAVPLLEALLAEGAALHGATSPALIPAWRMLGASRGNLGDQTGATAAMLKAVQLARADPAGVEGELLLAISDLARQSLDSGDLAAAAMLAAEVMVLGRHDDDSLMEEAQDGPALRGLAHLRQGRPVEAMVQALPLWRIEPEERTEEAQALVDLLDAELDRAAGGDASVIERWVAEALALEPGRAKAEARLTQALEPMMAAFQADDVLAADAAARAALDRVLADDPVVAASYFALLLSTLRIDRPDLAAAWAFRLAEMPALYLASLDNDPLPVLHEVAEGLLNDGRAREAAELAARMLDLAVLRDGAGARSVGRTLALLGAARRDLGQYAGAEEALRQALALALADGPPDPVAAQAAVQTLVDLAFLYDDSGDAASAGAAYAQALALLETGPAGDAAEGWYFVLDDYAAFLARSGQPEAAEDVARRAVDEISRRAPESLQVALSLLRLGLIQLDRDRPEAAEATLAQALALAGRVAPGDPALGRIRVAQARALDRLGHPEQASEILTASLATGAGGTAALTALIEAATATEAAGDAEGAVRLVAQVVVALPEDSPIRAYAEAAEGQLAYRAGDLDTALAAFRAATLALTQPDRRFEPRARDHLPLHVRAAGDSALRAEGTAALSLSTEAFQVAQRVNDLTAGAALGRATARLLGRGPEAAGLARDRDSAETRLSAAREALTAGLGAGADVTAARAELAAAREAFRQVSERLAAEFPDYAAFADPRPVDLMAAANLLAPGEVLVLFATSDVPGPDGQAASLAIAIGDGRMVTAPLPARAELAALARDLRCAAALTDRACGAATGQTRGAFSLAEPEAEAAAFDYALAHRAYTLLLQPLEQVTGKATSLILVPDRTLAALPFHLMLTEAVGLETPLQAAPWLIRRLPVTVVPTVAGLAGLRGAAPASAADRPFLGVGDPLIGTARNGPLPYDCAAPPPEIGLLAAALAAPALPMLRGGETDTLALAALPALPDTRCELSRTAELFGTPDALLLHAAATETAVKALSAAGELGRFRVLSFATHGLIAGEVGAQNAGLVLTPPANPNAFDDGLLTTAEIAELRLDADFVLLSACNTAAGSASSEEGLSGLASAFFLAGARSLLVSHWPVYSDAATRLTSGLVEAMSENPGIGRAEALRRAMLGILDDPQASDRMRHPAYWAPFMIVGEGAGG